MKILKKSVQLIGAVCWMVCHVVSLMAADDLSIKAYVDQTVIGLNQQFTLHVELSGQSLNTASSPQLPQMDRFAAYLGSSSSQNMQFINGKMSVSHVMSYHFQATTKGKFQIGPVEVQLAGKKYQTDPISIEITDSASQVQRGRSQDRTEQSRTIAGDDLFIRAQVNKNRVFQNEPVIVIYKIYTRVNVSSYGYSKIPAMTGFWVEEYDLGRQAQTTREILNGQQYTVATIRKMALFPMTPGEKTIESMGIQCEVRVRQRSRDIFDDFFSDPFGRSVRKTIQTEPIHITVLPLPEEGKPADFSGIVGKYQIFGSVDKNHIKTNEAVSFSFRITGEGNIRTLPEPKVVFPTDFEAYPPKITESIERKESAVTGSKTYEYILVPRAAGVQKIKSVILSVFEPATKRYRKLQTEEFVITVEKGDETYSGIPSGLSKEEVKLLGQDIRFIKTEIRAFKKIGDRFYKHLLFWLVMLGPLLAVAVSLGYRKHLDKLQGDLAYARDRRASRVSKKHLSSAKALQKLSTQKAFYAAIGKALIGYLGDKLNVPEAGIILDEVEKLLRKKGVSEDTIHAYFECLHICDMKRFSPSEATKIEMEETFQKVEKAINRLDKEIN